MPLQKPRMWWGIGVVVVAVLVVAIGVPVWRSVRSGDPAGTRVQADDTEPLPGARTGSVLLPTGELTVSVSRPATHFPADADPHGAAEPDRVERGGRWLAVGWALSPLKLPTAQLLVLGRTPAQFQVTLVADGARYDLAAGQTEDAYAATESRAGLAIAGRKLTLVDHKRVYVALPHAPGTTSVEVRYDGLTQRLDPDRATVERGAAAPLYHPAPDPKVTAGSGMALAAPGFGFLRDRRDDQVQLAVRATTALPYVPGLGWAADGRTWLAVPIYTNVVDPFVFWPTPEAAAHALYVLKLRSTTVTLDGAKPTLELSYYQQNAPATDSTLSAYYLWDVPASGPGRTLALHQSYRSGPPDEDAPATAPKQAAATADTTATITR
jgi:hypothetical protein